MDKSDFIGQRKNIQKKEEWFCKTWPWLYAQCWRRTCTCSTNFCTHMELLEFLRLVILCLMAFFSPPSSISPSPVQLLRNSAQTVMKRSLNPQVLIRCPYWRIQLYPVFTLLRYFSYLILKVYLPLHLFPLLSRCRLCFMHHITHNTWKAHKIY